MTEAGGAPTHITAIIGHPPMADPIPLRRRLQRILREIRRPSRVKADRLVFPPWALHSAAEEPAHRLSGAGHRMSGESASELKVFYRNRATTSPSAVRGYRAMSAGGRCAPAAARRGLGAPLSRPRSMRAASGSLSEFRLA